MNTARSEHLAVGTQGQLRKSQLPNAMGDVYPRWPPDSIGWWKNIELVLISYLTPAAVAAAVLPSEFSLPRVEADGLAALGLAFERFRAGGDLAAVALAYAKYGDGGSLAAYSEVFLGIPCLHQGQPYFYCPYIYVDTDAAMTAGRELLGFPKKLATFGLRSVDGQYIGTMDRHGVRVVTVTFKQQDRLLVLPLPAKEKGILPAPYDQMLPLPEPTGTPQGLPLPMLSTRFIAKAIAPQHMATLWKWEKGTVFAGKGSIEYGVSDVDPLAQLPVTHVIGSVLFKGDMSLYGDEAKVVAEMA